MFRVCEERGFRAPPKRDPETGTSCGYQHGTRDTHDMLRLLLQPPRSLCANTGHDPHLPSQSLCSPPPPGSRDPGTTSLGEDMACLRLVQVHAGLCHHRLAPHAVPLPPPSLSEPEPPISHYFNPVLSQGRTDDALRRPTCRGRYKSKAKPW